MGDMATLLNLSACQTAETLLQILLHHVAYLLVCIIVVTQIKDVNIPPIAKTPLPLLHKVSMKKRKGIFMDSMR